MGCKKPAALGVKYVMSDKVYSVPAVWKKKAYFDEASYKKTYAESVSNPSKFWAKQAKRLEWIKAPKKIKNVSYAYPDVSIKWYEDGVLNVSSNCIDRHLKKRANQTAIIWEGDNPYDDKKITYRELYENTCRMANVLKKHGVKKGDRVTIYLPMIPEATYAMLACARIGAVHSIVFGGFSPESLAGRIIDCASKFIITADEGQKNSIESQH
jgi:acetyl-CoA synthetase